MKILLLILFLLSACNIENNSVIVKADSSRDDTSNPDGGDSDGDLGNNGSSNSSGALTLHLEDAPDGNGSEILSLNTYAPTKLYAVSRNSDGIFNANETVDWSLSDTKGQLVNLNGTSTTFIPVDNSGTTTLSMNHATLENISADITINLTPITGIAGITVWYRSDNLLNLNDSSEVVQWENIVGATHATASNGPTLVKNSINNLPSLSFNGSNNSFNTNLDIDDIISSTNATVFAVFKVESIGTNNTSSYWYNDGVFADYGSNFGIFFRSSGPQMNVAKCHGTSGSCSAINSYTVTFNDFILVTMKLNGATLTSSVNNGVESSANSGSGVNISSNATNRKFHIAYTLSSNYFDGDISELIFFNNNISSSNENLIETYLCNKYNLTCN